MFRRFVLTCAALGGLLSAHAQVMDKPDSNLPAPIAIDMTVRSAMAEIHANGLAVAVIDAGQVVYVRAFGRRNDEGGPLTDDR